MLEKVKLEFPNEKIRIVFQGGGTIPIPDAFKEFCKKNGIEIVVLKPITALTTILDLLEQLGLEGIYQYMEEL